MDFLFWSRLVFFFHPKIIFLVSFFTFVETYYVFRLSFFAALFDSLFKLLSFWFNFFSFSFYSLLCFDSRTFFLFFFFLKKKKRFFWKLGRVPTRRSGKNLIFCFAHLSPLRKGCFFKTNRSEKYIFSNVQKNQKMNVEGTTFEIFP